MINATLPGEIKPEEIRRMRRRDMSIRNSEQYRGASTVSAPKPYAITFDVRVALRAALLTDITIN